MYLTHWYEYCTDIDNKDLHANWRNIHVYYSDCCDKLLHETQLALQNWVHHLCFFCFFFVFFFWGGAWSAYIIDYNNFNEFALSFATKIFAHVLFPISHWTILSPLCINPSAHCVAYTYHGQNSYYLPRAACAAIISISLITTRGTR